MSPLAKVATLITTLSLLICSTPSQASSHPKPGTSCAKAGLTKINKGMQFTCLKKGKKLTWSQGKIYPSTSNSTSPSKEALFVENQITEASKVIPMLSIPKHEVVVDPSIKDGPWLQATTYSIDPTIRLLKHLGFNFSQVPKLLIFRDFTWAKDKMTGSCLLWGENSAGGTCQSDIVFSNLGWFERRNYKTDKFNGIYDRMLISSNLPVGLLHVAQAEVFKESNNTNNPGRLNDIPAWISMGKMQFMKLASYSIVSGTKYSALRREYLVSVGNSCKNISLKSLSDVGPYESSCDWINGMLATELLIAKSGDLSSLLWWEQKAKSTRIESFKSAYGIDWDTFLSEADTYIKAQTP